MYIPFILLVIKTINNCEVNIFTLNFDMTDKIVLDNSETLIINGNSELGTKVSALKHKSKFFVRLQARVVVFSWPVPFYKFFLYVLTVLQPTNGIQRSEQL